MSHSKNPAEQTTANPPGERHDVAPLKPRNAAPLTKRGGCLYRCVCSGQLRRCKDFRRKECRSPSLETTGVPRVQERSHPVAHIDNNCSAADRGGAAHGVRSRPGGGARGASPLSAGAHAGAQARFIGHERDSARKNARGGTRRGPRSIPSNLGRFSDRPSANARIGLDDARILIARSLLAPIPPVVNRQGNS